MKGLVWLRNDIRLDDNPSLKRAFEECNSVICVYVWSPEQLKKHNDCLLYTSPSPRDGLLSRMPSSA